MTERHHYKYVVLDSSKENGLRAPGHMRARWKMEYMSYNDLTRVILRKFPENHNYTLSLNSMK